MSRMNDAGPDSQHSRSTEESDDTHGGGVAASVIIPVHNAQDSIGEQLGALAAQEGDVSFEVVVVLNRCTDDPERSSRAFATSSTSI